MKAKGKKYTEKEWIESIVQYFQGACKEKAYYLGGEFEHFLIDRLTLDSFAYFTPNGQKDLLNKMVESGWRLFSSEQGNPLGVEKGGDTITLEPGGQVEISLRPYKSVDEVAQGYKSVLSEIKAELSESQALASLGYHPKSKIEQLPLLPKKRYHLMYDYFKGNGRYCHNMMKGTAATQVSIDFTSEMDFVKKFRVANFLSPVLASLFDAAPVFEGELYPLDHCRAAIWNETDIKRSKLIPGALDRSFGFEDYANYLLDLPPILLQVSGEMVFTGNKALRSLLQSYAFTPADLEHQLSMVFPDVRVKKYLEIRMADAIAYPYNLSFIALVDTVFHSPELLECIYEKSLSYTDSWVTQQNQWLVHAKASDRNPEFDALKKWLMTMAIGGASEENKVYLETLNALLVAEGSMAKKLKKLYTSDLEAFKNAIIV